MKNLFLLLVLFFCLTINSAGAITFDVNTTVINIDGTSIYRSSIASIDYCGMDGVTYINLKNGTKLSFYTSYREYTEINRAYHTVMVAGGRVIPTCYGGYYSANYNQPQAGFVVNYNSTNRPTVAVPAPSYVSHNNYYSAPPSSNSVSYHTSNPSSYNAVRPAPPPRDFTGNPMLAPEGSRFAAPML